METKKCLCERTCKAFSLVLIKIRKLLVKYRPSITFFISLSVISGIIFITFGLSVKGKNSDFFTAAGSMFTLAAFLYAVHCYQSDYYHRNSEFYLNRTSDYFNNALAYIGDTNNNNIKWHQAIYCLVTADMLSKYLIDSAHQEIYVTNYINTFYSISNIIANINDHRFFYGIDNYEDKDDQELFDESGPKQGESLNKKCTRISPELLERICVFLEKAQKAAFDSTDNGTHLRDIFYADYFRIDISAVRASNLSDFTKIPLKVIYDYMEKYNQLFKQT